MTVYGCRVADACRSRSARCSGRQQLRRLRPLGGNVLQPLQERRAVPGTGSTGDEAIHSPRLVASRIESKSECDRVVWMLCHTGDDHVAEDQVTILDDLPGALDEVHPDVMGES